VLLCTVPKIMQCEIDGCQEQKKEHEQKLELTEWLHCMSWEVQQRATLEPTYFDPSHCYIRRPGKAICLHGADCRQDSAWHWHQFDHPSSHPLLTSPPLICPPWKLSELQVCRHFSKTGCCRANSSGGNCRFEHISNYDTNTDPKPPPLQQQKGRHQQQQQHGQAWASRRAPRKKRSAYGPTACFRRFLLDTFGLDTLQEGSGVADVAGGAGTLSYELRNLNSVRSTVYDPRQPCFKRGKKSVSHRRRQAENGNQALLYDTAALATTTTTTTATTEIAASTTSELTNEGEGEGQLPAWAEVWFGRWLWEGRGEMSDDGVLKDGSSRKDSKEVDRWHSTTTTDENERLVPLDHCDVLKSLEECSVVLGLHPDGATDAIVDFALAKGKPFAILPCCVYNKHFTSRKTVGGGPVRNHAELVDYLQAKHESIQRVELDCDGRNICLFWKGLK